MSDDANFNGPNFNESNFKESNADSCNRPIVVALGGNALADVFSNTESNLLYRASKTLAKHTESGLVITHGNGPQIGLLAEPRRDNTAPSLDVLNAQTEGWLGYEIEQHISAHLAAQQPVATLLTRVEVDLTADDSLKPRKPIGRWLDRSKAEALQRDLNWRFTERDGKYRRLVPSPEPSRCLQIPAIDTLLQQDHVVICAGGGGIPVMRDSHDNLVGIEAVIDKDLATSLIARQLNARLLVLATNVAGIYEAWPQSSQGDTSTPPNYIREIQAGELLKRQFEPGSMGPKAQAAGLFTRATGMPSVIGELSELDKLIACTAGTRVIH